MKEQSDKFSELENRLIESIIHRKEVSKKLVYSLWGVGLLTYLGLIVLIYISRNTKLFFLLMGVFVFQKIFSCTANRKDKNKLYHLIEKQNYIIEKLRDHE